MSLVNEAARIAAAQEEAFSEPKGPSRLQLAREAARTRTELAYERTKAREQDARHEMVEGFREFRQARIAKRNARYTAKVMKRFAKNL